MHYWFDQQVGRIEQDIEALAAKFRTLNVKVHPAMNRTDWQQLIDRMNKCSGSLLGFCEEIGTAITEEASAK